MLNVLLNSIYSVILAFQNWMKLSWQADKHTNIQSVAEKNTNYYSHTGRDTAQEDQSSNQPDAKHLIPFSFFIIFQTILFILRIIDNYTYCLFLSIYPRHQANKPLFSAAPTCYTPVTSPQCCSGAIWTWGGELWSQLGFIQTKNKKYYKWFLSSLASSRSGGSKDLLIRAKF